MRDEIPLKGGRVTQGVVRVGDTVRRPIGRHSAFVHELLRHLESIDFPHAPRFVGIDSQGREILSYLEGWVPPDLEAFSDAQMRAAARIIKRYHEATAGTSLAGDQEVVCHGDLNPCNFVFPDGSPQFLIDFDCAFPGPRRIDLGYAIWLWLDIGNPELDPHETGRRVAAFLEEYGRGGPLDPIQAILDAQDWLTDRCNERPSSYTGKVAAWARSCRRWVEQQRERLDAGVAQGAA